MSDANTRYLSASVPYDEASVARVARSLQEQAMDCRRNKDGQFLVLDAQMRHYGSLCLQLLDYIRGWAEAVFAGRAESNRGSEHHLRSALDSLLRGASSLAAIGRKTIGASPEPATQGLLDRAVAELHSLSQNWMLPMRAVAPSPRVPLPGDAREAAAATLARLSAEPASRNAAPVK